MASKTQFLRNEPHSTVIGVSKIEVSGSKNRCVDQQNEAQTAVLSGKMETQPLKVDRLVKIVIIGDRSTGKSIFLDVFLGDANAKLEDGDIHYGRKVIITSGEKIIVELHDNANGWSDTHLRKFYGRADATLVLYDVSRGSAFSTRGNWIRDLQQHIFDTSFTMALVGNKIDRCRVVQKEDAKLCARRNNMVFVETSTFDSSTVFTAVNKLLAQVMKKEA